MYKLNDCLGEAQLYRKDVNPILDLFAHLARCEANYSRLRKLMVSPQSDEFQSRTIVFANGSASLRFDHRVISRYTSSIVIRQTEVDTLTNLHLKLHVYHDTRAVEVVSYQKHHDFRVLERVPVAPRTQRFEKIEMNRFLSEVLDYCLSYGTAVESEAVVTAK